MPQPNRQISLLLLLGILLLASWLRLTGLAWDGYRHFHPDERYIAWVATTIEWAWPLAEAEASTLNPFYWPAEKTTSGVVVPQGERRDFAYGHWPLYAGVALTRGMEQVAQGLTGSLGWPPSGIWGDLLNVPGRSEMGHITAVGRFLTAMVDVAMVGLLFLLGWRLTGNTAVGLLSALLLALNVMHIQLAHFFATDPFMSLFVLATVLALVHSFYLAKQQARGQGGFFLLAGVFIGLAVGAKFSAILLFVALLVTAWLNWRWRAWLWLVGAGLLALLSFGLTNPYAWLDWGCTPLPIPFLEQTSLPGNCYLENVSNQSAMVRGSAQFPFTRQYEGTTPFLYFVEMQLRWGMGLLLGIAAWGGAVWLLGRTVWAWWQARREPINPENNLGFDYRAWLIVWAWCLPYFLSTGMFYVKFMRYLQPVTPFLMLCAGVVLLSLPWRWVRWGSTAVVILSTAVWAIAFSNLYQTPHPWLTASRWVYQNVPAGSLILSERWDDSLPTSLVHENPAYQRSQYRSESLTWLSAGGSADNEARLAANLALLAEGDYLVLASNRVYGVVPRLPEQYPLSSQLHPLLFAGKLGYEPVLVVGRAPTLAGWQFYPDYFGWPGLEPPTAVADFFAQRTTLSPGRVDESFTVYDQPLTIIFVNQQRLTAEEMAALFVGAGNE
jgi:4-amino-4-deoxy-L-arabinose transferase-like glycosyltransferase